MESKQEEAKRAMEIAESKLSENDYNGAKSFIEKAQTLYPTLDGLKQMLTTINVYISATKKINGEADWYGILCVDPLADEEVVKKHYKNLALLIHPDKNRFNGAEGAFKLVLQAFDLLSDKYQRIAYDQKRNSKQANNKKSGMHKSPKYTYKNKPKSKYGYESATESDSDSDFDPEPEPESSRKQENSWKPKKVTTFWTMCDRCKTYCQYVRSFSYLNKTRSCPNCGQYFYTSEVRLSTKNQSTGESTSDASSSTSTASDHTNEAQERESEEKIVDDAAAPRESEENIVDDDRGNENEAKRRLFKQEMQTLFLKKRKSSLNSN